MSHDVRQPWMSPALQYVYTFAGPLLLSNLKAPDRHLAKTTVYGHLPAPCYLYLAFLVRVL